MMARVVQAMRTLDMSCTCRSKSKAPAALLLSRAASAMIAASRSRDTADDASAVCNREFDAKSWYTP